MATDQKAPVVHPGDIIQNSAGDIMLVSETRPWGVGAVQRWRDGPTEREVYYRLKPGDFVIIGTAAILPKEIAERRANSLATAQQIEREQGGAS